MRLEANNLPPQYRGAKVLLNGVEQTNVFVADEEQGYIERYITDENSNPVPDDNKDNIKSERLEGEVKIILPPAGVVE